MFVVRYDDPREAVTGSVQPRRVPVVALQDLGPQLVAALPELEVRRLGPAGGVPFAGLLEVVDRGVEHVSLQSRAGDSELGVHP